MMTSEEWEKAEERLNSIFSRVELKIDNYTVIIMVEKYKMKLVFAVYVNGHIKGEWVINDCEIRDRFYQKHTTYLISKQKINKATKKMREFLNENNKEISTYSPYWGSFSRMKAHFIKNNTSIEFVE